MRKRLFFFCALFLFAQFGFAADVTAPANLPSYYSGVDGTNGSTLWSAVHTVAKKGYSTSISYKTVWTVYKTTDSYTSGGKTYIYDMYGGCSFIYSTNQCGSYSGECDCYNREHSIPKSWFGGSENADTPGSDVFHLVPTDGKINGTRSNYAFGEVQTAKTTHNPNDLVSKLSTVGGGKAITIENTMLGTTSTQSPGSNKQVFEPDDIYKGDFARGYFGTLLKWAGDYQAFTTDDGAVMFSGTYTEAGKWGLTPYGIALLLKWHRQDPVSQKEIDRNNGIQATQGNRNPFIDYPILAEYIWGKYSGQTFAISNAVGSFDTSNFTPGVSDGDKNSTDPAITSPKGTIDLGATNTEEANTVDVNVKGVNLNSGNLTLSITGTNASFFSLATTSITSSQALNGYNVTITYTPTSEGSHTATLTIKGCGISNHQVTLTGSCTAVHTITWSSAEGIQTTKAASGAVPPLPAQNPANCSSSRVFVGWTEQTNVSGTAPTDLFTTPTATINAPKTYRAVYADATTTGSGSTGSVTITTSTSNIPTSYGTANTFTEYTLEGYKFKIQQMYLNSGKLQWRAAGNSSGTGTMYNTSTFPGKLSSIVLTYNSSDNNKNFTLKVGSSQNPTDGTSITPTSSGSVYTFDCSDQNADYFVLTNGSGAGYLDQIVINYSGSSTTYSNYSLSCSSTPITYVTVTFHKNDGTSTTTTQDVPKSTSTALTANPWSRDHYTFSGWNTKSNGSGTSYSDGQSVTISAALDLYAQWTEDTKVTVSFMNNGAEFYSQTDYVGENILISGIPSLTDCDDYTFEGWSTSQYVEDNTSSPAIITPTTIPTGGATYYAVYTKSVTEGGSGGGGSSTANVSMESLAAASGTVGNYEFSTAKNNGSTAPTYNTNGKDLRIYAKGSVTISSSTAMTGIVFNLSSQGKKRLAPITASTGTIATQAYGDGIVTWTGSATSVTFTVGDNADYGTDGSTKAGQLCFLSVDITTGSGSGGTTTTYHTTAPNCSCEVIITITSADETMGTVEFVE